MIIILIINCQVHRDQRANLKQGMTASFRGAHSDASKKIAPLNSSRNFEKASFQSISPQSSITTFLLVFPDLEPKLSI